MKDIIKERMPGKDGIKFSLLEYDLYIECNKEEENKTKKCSIKVDIILFIISLLFIVDEKDK